MNKQSSNYLSRSALAEKLGVSLKELTQQLIHAGWLQHNEGADKSTEWTLTAKGEFEGGIYRESKKYGRYIVWPETVSAHPAMTELLDSLISATTIAKEYDLSAKIINQLLASIGWLSPFAKGWQVTEIGQQQGGVQQHADTGAPYVKWSRNILTNEYFNQLIQHFQAKDPQHFQKMIDGVTCYKTISGHWVESIDELHIAHSLTIVNIPYMYQKELMLLKSDIKSHRLTCTFYLPELKLIILYQPSNVSPDQLNQQLTQQTLLEKQPFTTLFVSDKDVSDIDKILAKAFNRLGVSI